LALRVANGRPVTVHAFEPDPAIAQQLRDRFANNAQVKVVGNGLSDTPHRTIFYKHRLDYLSSLHYTESEPNPSNYRERDVIGKVEVELTTVDAYCAAEGITRIDFLKVDVEGHDLFVLKGAQHMLGEARIQALQFEFCELNITSRATFFDFWNLLKDRYDLYRMCVDGEYRIERYDPLLHEIYYPVNFLARRKDQ